MRVQVQRLRVAQAYVRNTPVILLDEPFSGQDTQNKCAPPPSQNRW